MAIPIQILLWAREAQARTGASDMAVALALSVVGPESSYNAGALGDYAKGKPTSYGLTQLHTPGGLGDGHAVSELLDGPSNLAIAEAYIQSRLDAGAQPSDALSPWSTRSAGLAQLADVQAQLGTVPPGSGQITAAAASGVSFGLPGLPSWANWGSLSQGQQTAVLAGVAGVALLVILGDF